MVERSLKRRDPQAVFEPAHEGMPPMRRVQRCVRRWADRQKYELSEFRVNSA